MKKVRKFLPVSLYDLPGLESWLEEQANEGLFPTHIGDWTTFRTGAIPGTRFRLEAYSGTDILPKQEQLELYRQYGWQYALTIGKMFFLFYTTDPQAVELHTDRETRGLSLDKLTKQLKRYRIRQIVFLSLIVLLPLAACLLPALMPTSRFDVQPNRFGYLPISLLFLFHPAFLFGIPWLILSTVRQFREHKTLLELHDRLKQGLPPSPSPGPSRSRARQRAVSLILSGLLLLAVIGMNVIDRFSIPLAKFPLPYVSLEELEGESLATSEALYGYSFHDDDNQAEYHFSLLAPVWYEVGQYGLRPGDGPDNIFSPDPSDEQARYAPRMDMVYVHTLPFLAESVAHSLLEQERLINVYWIYEEVDYPGLDFAILAHEDDSVWQMAAIGHGGRVAVFRYAGGEDLAEQLDLLSTIVTD